MLNCCRVLGWSGWSGRGLVGCTNEVRAIEVVLGCGGQGEGEVRSRFWQGESTGCFVIQGGVRMLLVCDDCFATSLFKLLPREGMTGRLFYVVSILRNR